MKYFISFLVLTLFLLPLLFYLIINITNKNALKKIGGEIKITKFTPTPIPSGAKSADLSKILITINTGFKITVEDNNNQEVGYQNVQQPLNDPVTGQAGRQQAKIFYYVDKPKSGYYFVTISSESSKQYEANFYLYDNDANVKLIKENNTIILNSTDRYKINFNVAGNYTVEKI